MHIALVEDDSDQRDLMELWLGSGQHTSHGFGTAAEFIDGLKKERFDLLLIDWMLPDGTGGDVLRSGSVELVGLAVQGQVTPRPLSDQCA